MKITSINTYSLYCKMVLVSIQTDEGIKGIGQFIAFSKSIEEIENKIQLFTTSNPDLKIFNKINCVEDIEKITSGKMENVEKIDKYINFFKKESDLILIKNLKKELELIHDDLKIERNI